MVEVMYWPARNSHTRAFIASILLHNVELTDKTKQAIKRLTQQSNENLPYTHSFILLT